MAFLIPSALFLLLLVKKLTVTGIIEYTQGVINASKPPAKAVRKIHHKDFVEMVPPLLAFINCAASLLIPGGDDCGKTKIWNSSSFDG